MTVSCRWAAMVMLQVADKHQEAVLDEVRRYE
jgi:hypothetical protein